MRLEHPEDAIYFDAGLTWPPPSSENERVLREAFESALVMGDAAVITRVDTERGVITVDRATLCSHQWTLQPCELGKAAGPAVPANVASLAGCDSLAERGDA